MRFFDFLFPPRVDERAIRGVSPDAFLSRMAPRLVPHTRPDTVALLPFSDRTVRAAIHETKYHGNALAIGLLGLALAEYLGERDEERGKRIVVPIPLSSVRQKERGFNQVEEVARSALAALGEACPDTLDASLLVRTRHTDSQVSLQRHRREENMRGAFCAARAAHPAYTYILVDDVLTTGATLQAAVDALRGAGAQHIVPLALAH